MPTILEARDPIGVFDSGIGGLTVVRALIEELPNERIVYFGDTARVPYGTKSQEAVIRFSKENVAFLLRHKVKMVVVACNTASSWALDILTEAFPLPILGVIAPGARKAARTTRNKKVGVIATPSTIASNQYARHVAALDRGIRVFSKACPLFVPLVEEGRLKGKITTDIVREYLTPFKKAHVDTLILGCTHYPLLKKVIHQVMGAKVVLVDSASEIAQEVKNVLGQRYLLRSGGAKPRHTFLVSDQPRHFQKLAGQFLGWEPTSVQRSIDV